MYHSICRTAGRTNIHLIIRHCPGGDRTRRVNHKHIRQLTDTETHTGSEGGISMSHVGVGDEGCAGGDGGVELSCDEYTARRFALVSTEE